MKQRITVDQFYELSAKQKERLADLWGKEHPQKGIPLLTIGEMIELLNDLYVNYIDVIENNERTIELCDSLWAAIKESLK